MTVKMSLTPTLSKRRREDGSPPKALTMPGETCKHCNKKCTSKGKSSEAIQCDICYVWVHASCESFSKEQYKTFSDLSKSFPNLAYCCKLNGCFTRLNQLIARNNTFETINKPDDKRGEEIMEYHSSLKQSISDVSSKILNLSSSYSTLESNLNDNKRSIKPQETLTAANALTSTSVAINVVDEISERDKRKCNLIIHNLSEEPLDNPHTDADNFTELCKSALDLNINVVKAFRLGQKLSTESDTARKPRTLLIKLPDEQTQKKVLACAPKLRFSETWGQVYIQPDMSPKEREAHRKVYEELKKRKN